MLAAGRRVWPRRVRYDAGATAGALTPADRPDATVRIARCGCDRRGQYRLATLRALYGEAFGLSEGLGHIGL